MYFPSSPLCGADDNNLQERPSRRPRSRSPRQATRSCFRTGRRMRLRSPWGRTSRRGRGLVEEKSESGSRGLFCLDTSSHGGDVDCCKQKFEVLFCFCFVSSPSRLRPHLAKIAGHGHATVRLRRCRFSRGIFVFTLRAATRRGNEEVSPSTQINRRFDMICTQPVVS